MASNDTSKNHDPSAGDREGLGHLITLVDQPPRDREHLVWTTVACAAAVVAILVSYLMGASQQWGDGFVEVAVQHVDGVSVPQPDGGAVLAPTGALEATVDSAALPGGAVAFLWLAEALQAVQACAVVVLLGLLARSIAVGRLFRPQTMRLLNWFTVGVLALATVPFALRHMGTNWVISAAGWDSSASPAPDTGSPVWIAYFAALFCVCMQVALRSGARLARDQDGLV